MVKFPKNEKGSSVALGFCVMYPSAGVVERIGPDWDWIWIDGQHGECGSHNWVELVRAADLVQRPALIRVAGQEGGPIGRALDTGASGVIVPCVDTVDQAMAVVRAAKFPPLGNRSYGGRRPVDFGGREYSDTANDDCMLVVQIESPEALDNARSIAAVPGVDALFLGPDDLLLRRGYSMTAPRTRAILEEAAKAVVEAAHAEGKLAVTVAANPEVLEMCLELGYDLLVVASDVGFLAAASEQAAGAARAAIGAHQTAQLNSNGSLY